MEITEKQHFKESLFIPLFFVSFLWLIKIMERFGYYNFENWGLWPRHLEGLPGILTMPLVHGNARPFEALGDYAHLASNSAPLLFLGFLLLQLYRPIAWRVVWQIWLIAGTITWLIARSETLSGDPVRHIGASGIVYGFAFFLFASGILRGDRRSMALSLMMVFVYGSMVWGLLPLMKGVSFEGHIAGAVAGISVAFLHKNYLQATAPKKIILPPSPQEDPLNAHENPWWVPPPPPKDLIDFINQLHQQQNPTNPAITPNENQQQNPPTPLEIKYIIIKDKDKE
jgi:hypothetical protein